MTQRCRHSLRHRSVARARIAQAGFTLVEVLVALVLMAIVSLVSWQGLDSVVRVRDHVEREAARDQAALNAIGQLTTDIQMRAANHVFDGSSTEVGAIGTPGIAFCRDRPGASG